MANKHFQFLRKTVSGTCADAQAAIKAKIADGTLYEGEPIVAFYESPHAEGETDIKAKGVVLAFADGTKGDNGDGFLFYNAATVKELIATAKTDILGAGVSDDYNTLKKLEDKIKAVQTKASSYIAGDDIEFIDITEGDDAGKTSINVSLKEDVTALGVSFGGINNGETISAGTNLTDVLKKLLILVKERTINKPTVTLTGVTGGTKEVGTVVTGTLGHTYTDGSFTGDAADGFNPTSAAAGCTKGTVTYYAQGSATTTSLNATITEGSNNFYCTAAYGASSNANIKNNGTTDSKGIAAGTATASTVTITGQYKYYYGGTTADVPSGVTTTGLSTGWTAVNNTTTIKSSSTKYTLPTTYFAIMCHNKYKLASIQDYTSGSSYLANFTEGTTTVTIGGGATATYRVYLWKKSAAQPDTKNITLTKA